MVKTGNNLRMIIVCRLICIMRICISAILVFLLSPYCWAKLSNNLTLRAILAKNIRTCRKEKQLSQEKLAELCGLHRTYVGSVERGERNVSVDNIEKIANALRVPASKLLIGK